MKKGFLDKIFAQVNMANIKQKNDLGLFLITNF
jgi:hypothetical protein